MSRNSVAQNEYNPHSLIAQAETLEAEISVLQDEGLRGWWRASTEDRRFWQVPAGFLRNLRLVVTDDLPKVARALYWRARGRDRLAEHLYHVLDALRYAAPDWYFSRPWQLLMLAGNGFRDAVLTGQAEPLAMAPALEPAPPEPAVVRLEVTIRVITGDGETVKTVSLTA